MMADKWSLTREELDRFSFESHVKAAAATRRGDFLREIVPIEVTLPDGRTEAMAIDEGIRFEPNLEKMSKLQPAFKADGVITAANSSQISDGAAALLLTSADKARELGLRPRARIVARAVVGSDPVLMLSGPIPATRRVLSRAGLKLDDIAAFEINEAFASVVLAWQKEVQPDPARVNPNGGAIALGHPLGATGAVLMTKLLHHLECIGGRYGLQTMCIGHGMATATIIERL
jgi:acetyl-CoA acyltransferase